MVEDYKLHTLSYSLTCTILRKSSAGHWEQLGSRLRGRRKTWTNWREEVTVTHPRQPGRAGLHSSTFRGKAVLFSLYRALVKLHWACSVQMSSYLLGIEQSFAEQGASRRDHLINKDRGVSSLVFSWTAAVKSNGQSSQKSGMCANKNCLIVIRAPYRRRFWNSLPEGTKHM